MKAVRKPVAETNVVRKHGNSQYVAVSSAWIGQKVSVVRQDTLDEITGIVIRLGGSGGAYVWSPKSWLGKEVMVKPTV